MIILFLKYYSVRRAEDTEKKKQREQGTVKEVKETRIIQDTPDIPPSSMSSGADVGETLG